MSIKGDSIKKINNNNVFCFCFDSLCLQFVISESVLSDNKQTLDNVGHTLAAST